MSTSVSPQTKRKRCEDRDSYFPVPIPRDALAESFSLVELPAEVLVDVGSDAGTFQDAIVVAVPLWDDVDGPLRMHKWQITEGAVPTLLQKSLQFEPYRWVKVTDLQNQGWLTSKVVSALAPLRPQSLDLSCCRGISAPKLLRFKGCVKRLNLLATLTGRSILIDAAPLLKKLEALILDEVDRDDTVLRQTVDVSVALEKGMGGWHTADAELATLRTLQNRFNDTVDNFEDDKSTALVNINGRVFSQAEAFWHAIEAVPPEMFADLMRCVRERSATWLTPLRKTLLSVLEKSWHCLGHVLEHQSLPVTHKMAGLYPLECFMKALDIEGDENNHSCFSNAMGDQVVYFRGERYTAIGNCVASVELSPNNADAWNMLAWLMHPKTEVTVSSVKYDRVTAAVKSLELCPTKWYTWDTLAVALKSEGQASVQVLGETVDATACFAKAMEHNVIFNRRESWESLGRHLEEIGACSAVVRGVSHSIAECLEKSGRPVTSESK